MAELAKIAPDIPDDRARLVIDCRGEDAAHAEATAREALQRLRSSSDTASLRVLLYGPVDQALVEGTTYGHVSADADFLDRFVAFRGLLVGQKADAGNSLSLSISKRRVPPLSPKTPPAPTSPVEPTPLPPPEVPAPAPGPRSPRTLAAEATVTTPPINSLAMSGTRFGGFSSSTSTAKPTLAPLVRTPSTSRVVKRTPSSAPRDR